MKIESGRCGTKGGEATAKNHDKGFYQDIGEKGGKANAKSHDKKHFQKIGKMCAEARNNK
ncbi:general stress protein [Jeotgalibacillus soli]|uniref:General stress protein n=1 Tax=Jeotgalibacillus soli TaxID=889306 RepID=A0A0C2R4H9_9BACL|nr:general stress protein [Jeotgalibacillus soli]KIL45160.1 general stress protein [Jeotgalibacillus soli]